MKRRLVTLAVAVVAVFGASSAAPAAPVAVAPLTAAKACNSGWTHGVIGGEHKCLRAGQFCARRSEADYHRYGFHCHRYDAEVARYRLTR